MHYQYIKILTVCVSVRLSVCNGSGAGLDYSDVRPSYFNLLNLELCIESSRIVDKLESSRTAGTEQQLKRTQSGSSS